MNRATCSYFVTCDHPAEGVIANPVIGDVPTCQRCADVVGLELVTDPERCLTLGVVPTVPSADPESFGVAWARELGAFIVRYSWANRALSRAIDRFREPGTRRGPGDGTDGVMIVGFELVGEQVAVPTFWQRCATVALRDGDGPVRYFALRRGGPLELDG